MSAVLPNMSDLIHQQFLSIHSNVSAFMYCLLQLVSNGLTPVLFMLTFKWCTHNVPCTQIVSTQCYLPIPCCVCGPSWWSLVCCEQLELLCQVHNPFIFGMLGWWLQCRVTFVLTPTPSCFASLVEWQSASCPHSPDTTTYVAMPHCTTANIEQNSYFLFNQSLWTDLTTHWLWGPLNVQEVNENLYCPFLYQFIFCDLAKCVLFSLRKMFSPKQDKEFEQGHEI